MAEIGFRADAYADIQGLKAQPLPVESLFAPALLDT